MLVSTHKAKIGTQILFACFKKESILNLNKRLKRTIELLTKAATRFWNRDKVHSFLSSFVVFEIFIVLNGFH